MECVMFHATELYDQNGHYYRHLAMIFPEATGVLGMANSTVHPRACGERLLPRDSARSRSGSSPRVRGTDLDPRVQKIDHRFIPARAGNGRGGLGVLMSDPVHPRACGEGSLMSSTCTMSSGSSPRVRGTGESRPPWRRPGRFIPARAGNGRLCPTSRIACSVHPRACGEGIYPCALLPPKSGSSPRVRGTGRALVY